jgi:hypothetical protein
MIESGQRCVHAHRNDRKHHGPTSVLPGAHDVDDDEDLRIVMHLGARIFDQVAAALRLAFSGYYLATTLQICGQSAWRAILFCAASPSGEGSRFVWWMTQKLDENRKFALGQKQTLGPYYPFIVVRIRPASRT